VAVSVAVMPAKNALADAHFMFFFMELVIFSAGILPQEPV